MRTILVARCCSMTQRLLCVLERLEYDRYALRRVWAQRRDLREL
jgi:hypothetical protein